MGGATEFEVTSSTVGIAGGVDLSHATFHGESFCVEFNGISPLLYFEIFVACSTVASEIELRRTSGNMLIN